MKKIHKILNRDRSSFTDVVGWKPRGCDCKESDCGTEVKKFDLLEVCEDVPNLLALNADSLNVKFTVKTSGSVW